MESTATAASAAKTGTSRNTACRIADDDHPGGDPDTRLQPFRRGQRSNRLDQGEAGAPPVISLAIAG